MKNNEAIGILNGMARNCKNMPRGYEDPDRNVKQEALNMAVEALEKHDTAEDPAPISNARWLQMSNIPLNSVEITSTGFSIAGERYNIDAGCDDEDEAMSAYLEWLDKEHEEDILTSTERYYLLTVLKPIRDEVYYIIRNRHNGIPCLDLIKRNSKHSRKVIGNIPINPGAFSRMKESTYYRVEDLIQ